MSDSANKSGRRGSIVVPLAIALTSMLAASSPVRAQGTGGPPNAYVGDPDHAIRALDPAGGGSLKNDHAIATIPKLGPSRTVSQHGGTRGLPLGTR